MSHTPTFLTWTDFFLPLTVGVSVIVLLAEGVSRRITTVRCQRSVWQTCSVGIALVLMCELTGVASGMLDWTVGWLGTPRSLVVERMAEQPPANPSPALDPEVLRRRGQDASSAEWPITREWPEQTAGEPFDRISLEEPLAPQPPRGLTKLDQATWWPAVVWLSGTALILGRLGVGCFLLTVLRSRRRLSCGGALRERVQEVARRLGMSPRVDVVISSGLCGPIAFGVLRPTIGLPGRFAEQFDRSQQEALLAHELGHLAAHDPAWQMLADVVAAALWWHPLVWWSRHELRSASELAADEASFALPDGAESLAACLVAMGGRLLWRHPVGWAGIEGNGFRSSLGRRVERLLTATNRSWPQSRSTSARFFKVVGLAVMVAVAMASTAWSRPREIQKGDSMSQILQHSWRHSLAAVTFVSLFGAVDSAPAVGNPRETLATSAVETGTPDREVVRETLSDRLLAQREKNSLKERRDELDFISEAEHAKIAQAKERLDQLAREIEKLRSAGQTEQADKLAAEYKELRGHLEARHEKKGDKSDAGDDDLKARLKALEAENARLRELLGAKEGVQFEERKHTVAKSPPEKPTARKGADTPRELQFKLNAMEAEIAELRQAGRKEEAEKLAAAARDIGEHAKHTAIARDELAPPAELREKFEAVAKEAAKLREAGKVEEANELLGKVQTDARQYEEHYKRQLLDKGYAPRGAEPNELGQVINQLREEVNRLREEVTDLRRAMKERGGDEKPVEKRPR